MSKKIIVVEQPSNSLPIKKVLDWETFQLFCTDVLATDPRFCNARDFLKQGNKQDGIDVYAIPMENEKITVAQCKLREYIPPGELHTIVDKFLEGNFADVTKQFILCTNYEFSTAEAEKVLSEIHTKLQNAGIDFIPWDKGGLETELRKNPRPQIVTRYFGEELALAFYGETFRSWIKQWRKVKKRLYKVQADYIERTLILYDDVLKRQGACFGFEKTDKTLSSIFSTTSKGSSNQMVMLSVAGFGKTWEMKQLAAYFSDEDKVLFPILNYLKDYEGQGIDDLLKMHEVDWEFIPKESLLLIFDGLDEIKSAHFQTFSNHLNQFAEANPDVNIIVSSRFNFYNISYPPLRDFDIYVLNEFTEDDVEAYLAKSLPTKETVFRKKLALTGFSEYAQHPYYLSRLVRFFQDFSKPFPTNRPELFERIFFERYERDKNQYGVELTRADFLSCAEKVAFCITLLGKSNLSEEELLAIIPDKDLRNGFKKFFLLTTDIGSSGDLSFEHKNLQEFLCASFLQRMPFSELKALLTFKHAPELLQPRFLNTVAFLFEISSGSFFEKLLTWLQISQPEVLVRFEKDKISKEIRFEIFKHIMSNYGEKDQPLYNSSYFTITELADFVEYDVDMVNYLEEGFVNPRTSEWVIRDIIDLLSTHKKAFIHKKRIVEIILKFLQAKRSDKLAPACIIALSKLQAFSKHTIETIFNLNVNIQKFDVRRTLVHFIGMAGLTEEYGAFMLESVPVYEDAQKKTVSIGANEELSRIISEFKQPINIKKAIQWLIANPNSITEYGSYRAVHFKKYEISTLLENALIAHASDSSILRCVYRLFTVNYRLAFDEEYSKAFKTFFTSTCGDFFMFKKLYKYEKHGRDMILFVTAEGCKFLLDEYRSGKISDERMKQIRNRLCWADKSLYSNLQDALLKDFGEKFAVDETFIDYQKIWDGNAIKNQEMLLNRDLFFEEAERFATAIGKERFTYDDLWPDDEKKLAPFQRSLVADTVGQWANKSLSTMEEIIGGLRKDENWEWFKIKAIKNLLLQRENGIVIDSKLINFAEAWCKEKIKCLDYENAIQQTQRNSWQYNTLVHFNNSLYDLLQMDLEDELLLKMLLAETEGGFNRGELRLAGVIVDKVKDKVLMKQTILGNLNKNLPLVVLRTHFALCHHLGYDECLPALYNCVNEHPLLDYHNKIVLVDYYVDLGGNIEDFQQQLPDEAPTEPYYDSFMWFLLDKMKEASSASVQPILLNALDNPDQHEENKIQACKLLISLNNLDGLYYWRDYVLRNKHLPFDRYQEVLLQHGSQMPVYQTIPVLMEVLEFALTNNLTQDDVFETSISDAVFENLHAIALAEYANFEKVIAALDEVAENCPSIPETRIINFRKERIALDFYKQHSIQYKIEAAIAIYAGLSGK